MGWDIFSITQISIANSTDASDFVRKEGKAIVTKSSDVIQDGERFKITAARGQTQISTDFSTVTGLMQFIRARRDK